jgi:subtilisin-like proprotein convertase family protein
MTNEQEKDLGTYLWRGGDRINIRKVPDRFSVRLKRGTSPSEVATSYHAAHRGSLTRQNLEEFAVDSSECDATMNRIRQGDEVDFASHVYALESDPTSRLYLSDEITVQFKTEVSDDEIEHLTVELGLDLVKEVPGAPRTYVFRVGPQAKMNPIKIANLLKEKEQVLESEPNIVIRARSLHVPTDPRFSDQWHLHHTGGPFLAADSHIDAVKAWEVTHGERSVVVAVADDSVDLNHVDFQGAGKIVAPVDFNGRDFEPLPETVDDNHGTACAGVAVAEENGHGVVGVAPGCALMPIRTSGFIDDNSIEELFEWVIERGASVVSCSWSAAAIFFSLSLRMRLALNRAATQGRNGLGCVIVFAAGNENRPVNGTVNEQGWPNNAPSGSTHWLNGFATHQDVISVAACTSLTRKSAYSNWGDEISVCAPSNNAPPRTFPEVTTPLVGRGIVTTDRVGPSGYSTTDFTFGFGGTSSACPTVAGVAALVLSANPDLSAQQVRQVLETTADKIVDNQPDPQLGNSFGSYDQNGHSQWFGYGKVNAFRAVQEAIRLRDEAGVQTFRKASAPALSIPDNNVAGARDTITFSDAVIVTSVRVDVDITHTYRGDLRLTLISPSGTEVVLHDRAGGGADHIQRGFDPTTTAGLNHLVGEPIQGDWTLHVQDLAPLDRGELNRWELEIEGRVDAVVELEETPGVTIPDDDPNGIERRLTTSASGRVQRVEVSLDVTHTFIRDLVVRLESPAGTRVALHERSGGSADNIITTYTPATTPDLQTLSGETIQGTWRLSVADLAGLDIGKLNRWALRIVREP